MPRPQTGGQPALTEKLFVSPAIRHRGLRRECRDRSQGSCGGPRLLRLMGVGLVVVGPEGPLVAGSRTICRARGSLSSAMAGKRPGWRVRRPSPRRCATRPACKRRPMGASAMLPPRRRIYRGAGSADRGEVRWARGGQGRRRGADRDRGCDAVDMMFAGQFGGAPRVVIVEFMEGEEASFFASSMASRCCRSPRRRTTSASATATWGRTPAAWAPIRPRPSSRPPSRPR